MHALHALFHWRQPSDLIFLEDFFGTITPPICMDVDAYLAPSCKHVVQKLSSRTSTSVHAHGRHHHLHNVHDLLHARYVKGRRAKG
jgi:hypothetical protein